MNKVEATVMVVLAIVVAVVLKTMRQDVREQERQQMELNWSCGVYPDNIDN